MEAEKSQKASPHPDLRKPYIRVVSRLQIPQNTTLAGSSNTSAEPLGNFAAALMHHLLALNGAGRWRAEGSTARYSTRFKNSCVAAMRSSSEEGSYSRLVDLLYHSSLGRE